jgi:hypothetical protein
MCLLQEEAASIMGLNINNSTLSMMIQAYKVCCVAWGDFSQDQQRPQPLVHWRFYNTKYPKFVRKETMQRFLEEVVMGKAKRSGTHTTGMSFMHTVRMTGQGVRSRG